MTRQFPEGTINITPQEAAILQTYPADFKFVGNKGEVGLAIGNAVPPLLAQRVLEALWATPDDLELAA